MPLGQRVTHMAPERCRCLCDLCGELVVGTGDGLPNVKARSIHAPAAFGAHWRLDGRRSKSRTADRSGVTAPALPTSPRAHGQNVVLIDERVTAARHCVRKTTAPLHVLEVERREP